MPRCWSSPGAAPALNEGQYIHRNTVPGGGDDEEVEDERKYSETEVTVLDIIKVLGVGRRLSYMKADA